MCAGERGSRQGGFWGRRLLVLCESRVGRGRPDAGITGRQRPAPARAVLWSTFLLYQTLFFSI